MSPALLARAAARRGGAARRRRLTAAARAVVAAQEKALGAHPLDPAVAPARLVDLQRQLQALGRDLRPGARRDARHRAALRGVESLARAYGHLAAAEREADLAQATALGTKARRELDAAVADRRKAGDAWPL